MEIEGPQEKENELDLENENGVEP